MCIRFKPILFAEEKCVLLLASAYDIYDEKLCGDIPPSNIVGADEHIKRYKKVADRNRSALGFAALQRCLEHFGITPGTASLSILDGGKPALDGCDIEFNISHSESMAVCLARRGFSVGVDIERIDKEYLDRQQKIADRFFAASELRILRESASPKVEFTRLWTCHEALGKYLGVGFFRGDPQKYSTENRLELRSVYVSSDGGRIDDTLFEEASYVLTVCVGSEQDSGRDVIRYE